MTTIDANQADFASADLRRLRADLALALRAAAHHGLAEGVCNHFSIELPDGSGRFLLNPRGLLWHEVQADDIVMGCRGRPRRPHPSPARSARLRRHRHGVVVCGPRIDHAYDDLYYLERACMAEVLARSTGVPLAPVEAAIAERVCDQTLGDRLQSELFFEALRRTL